MLRVEDLSVSYGNVQALDGVNLEVASRGVLHGIIGPNGAGKSTLMDAITGRRRPTRGRVFVDGQDITLRSVAWRRRAGMSRSFQRTSIFPGITVREQVELVASELGEQDLDEVIDAFELRHTLDEPADGIAYGDQRRVDIALAMIGKPSLMLLDEPAAGLSTTETTGALFDAQAPGSTLRLPTKPLTGDSMLVLPSEMRSSSRRACACENCALARSSWATAAE